MDNENIIPNLKRKRSPSLTKYRKCYRSNSKNRGENRERGSYRSSRIDPYRFKSRSRSRSNRRSHRSRSRSKHHQRDIRRQEKEDVVTNNVTRASQPVRNQLSAHEKYVARRDDEEEGELKEMKKKLAMRQTLKKTRKMLKSVKTLRGETFGLRKQCV